MSRGITVGLVGSGYWGKKLLPNFLEAPDSAVRWVCDIHPEHRAEVRKNFPELSVKDSFDAALEDSDTQAVILATPPATHFWLANKALEAGKHVWIEKPFALTLCEGRQLVELAKAKGKVVFVDHTFLYDRALKEIRRLVQTGGLGKIHHLFLQRLNLGRIKRDSSVWWNSAPHDVSIIFYLLPARLTNIALHGYRYLQPNLEDLALAVLEMSNGASAFVYHNWLYPENTAKLTIVGSKKLLIYEGKFNKRSVTVYDYQVDDPAPGAVPANKLPTTIASKIVGERRLEGIYDQEPLALAVADFLQSIQNGHPPQSDGEFSLNVLAALEAGERSIRSGGAKVEVEI